MESITGTTIQGISVKFTKEQALAVIKALGKQIELECGFEKDIGLVKFQTATFEAYNIVKNAI